MWSLEHLQHLNSPAETRKRLTSSRLLFIKTEADLGRTVPWLAHSPERHDRCHKRLVEFTTWDRGTLKRTLREFGPFRASRDTDGRLICWSPQWVQPETA